MITHIPSLSCSYAEQRAKMFDGQALFVSEAHYEYEVIFVVSGQVRATVEDRSYTLESGCILFISRMERHSFLVLKEPYIRYVITLSSDLIMSRIPDSELASIFIQRPASFCHGFLLAADVIPRMLDITCALYEECRLKQPFWLTRGASLITDLLIELYRSDAARFPHSGAGSMSDAVFSAQRFVNDNFHQSITLGQIAAQNFVSRHALSLAFHRIVGIPFKDYLLLFRLTEAKKLLETTSLSVEEIAARSGYQNVNNFIRMFKSKEGITPLQYKKKRFPAAFQETAHAPRTVRGNR